MGDDGAFISASACVVGSIGDVMADDESSGIIALIVILQPLGIPISAFIKSLNIVNILLCLNEVGTTKRVTFCCSNFGSMTCVFNKICFKMFSV